MTEPASKKPRTASPASFLTFGEAMIRFAPLDEVPPTSVTRHLPQPFLRSLGGDELNVAVALSKIGTPSRWISVLPTGPLGDVVTEACAHNGVAFAGPRVQDADLGTFTVLPETKTVHYQRRHSAFALQEPKALDWAELLGNAHAPWLHVTGITPLVSAAAAASWAAALRAAAAAGIPASLDLNHRAQLGSLEELWALVAPHAASLEVLLLSLEQLQGLIALQLDNGARVQLTAASSDAECFSAIERLQARWRTKRVALCRKTRAEDGVQRRWSLLTVADGAGGFARHSTHDTPVYHVPKEECGGGSAWLAGLLHALHFAPAGAAALALRRADLLSALCQESAGDFSLVSAAELSTSEAAHAGAPARLPGAEAGGGGGGGAAGGGVAALALPPADGARRAVEGTLGGLRRAGVLAILRAKGDAAVAVARGVELAAMGCRAMEVTLDSGDWPAVLRGLRAQLPADVLLGVGTVMDDSVCQVARAAALGATFALSPIDPIGFVDECHRRGVLAIPSAFTSNECWALHRRGVRLIKLFHAGLASPAILKSMLDVSPLGAHLNILPSGGVSPANAEQWWAAGAAVVGMGSNLVGKDIATTPGTAAHDAAVAEWAAKGKQTAQALFEQVAKRSVA